MQKLTSEGQNLVNDLSNRYNLSPNAIIYMIGAVNNGGGTMAQFSSPELGGSGQWMKGGMTMVGDMFNNGLKNTVDNLCTEISNALLNMQIFPQAPAGTRESNQWWPTNLGLGSPFSSGGQNNIRYAVFPNRLAVEVNGNVSVYDTLDNNIGGVSQQQGGDTSLTFSSQYGTISVSTLPIIYGQGNIPPVAQNNFASPTENNFSQTPQNNATNQTPITTKQPEANIKPNVSSDTIIELIEKLSSLYDAGALTSDEFNTKKTELLSRL
ncbi:SHOCT domain-containing protein [Sulfurimonas aquatica]|uniref:SHOCT domain-containing protein n=1 Tax=Sulfurimonas aquatica TaxID=2672570 RepID=A0A975GCS5_9BACT|nr:SHOCT domain-containing protein [Sulfurimonas aquatica]QSZ41930.1 SHOCT domain-containing protein [Sulfurimonas aquatica]